MGDTREKAPSEDGAAVRPEGFEPPTYWSVAYEDEGEVVCQCGHGDYRHDEHGDCSQCSCRRWYGEGRWSLDDEHALRLVMDAAAAL